MSATAPTLDWHRRSRQGICALANCDDPSVAEVLAKSRPSSYARAACRGVGPRKFCESPRVALLEGAVCPELDNAAAADVRPYVVSDSTVSDSAVSDSAVSDSTVSDSTVSDSTVSDSTVSDSTVSDSTVSDSTVSDSTVSDSTVALRRQDLALLEDELLVRQHPPISQAFQSFKLFDRIGSGGGLFGRAGGLRIRIDRGRHGRSILHPILLVEQSHAPTVAVRSNTARHLAERSRPDRHTRRSSANVRPEPTNSQ